MIDVHSEEYILGQNIKKYRMLKKWTQSKLSEAVDIDRAEISKYESGQNGEMGFKMLKRFAKALDVSTEQLLDDEDEPPEKNEQHMVEDQIRMDKEAGREPLAYDPQFFYDTIVELMEQDVE